VTRLTSSAKYTRQQSVNSGVTVTVTVMMMMMMMMYLGDECGGDEVRVWKHGTISGDGHVQLSGVRHERHADGGSVERREPEHDVTHLSTAHADGAVRPG